jgi:hypothetical protein
MVGNLVLSLISGAAAGAGMYLVYGTARFKAQVGENRLRSSVIVGVAVAVIGFALRYAEVF